MEPRRCLLSGDGRLRLGWRLLAFASVFVFLVLLQAAVVGDEGVRVQGTVTLVAALGAGWLLLGADGRRPAALGFHLARSVPGELGKGFLLGAAVAGLVVAVIALAGGVRWGTEPGSLVAWLTAGGASLAFFALPAAAEEALFRGYPLQALAEAWGPGAALVVTSAAFGLVHLSNPNADWIGAVNVAGAGLLLGAVFLRTASLWWATAAHLAWNWTHGFLADLPVSGLDVVDAPWVVGRAAGPAWVSGGAFGPEASLLTTLVVAGAAIWTWRTPRLGPVPAAVAAGPLFPPPGRSGGGSEGPRDVPGEDEGAGGAPREADGTRSTEAERTS